MFMLKVEVFIYGYHFCTAISSVYHLFISRNALIATPSRNCNHASAASYLTGLLSFFFVVFVRLYLRNEVYVLFLVRYRFSFSHILNPNLVSPPQNVVVLKKDYYSVYAHLYSVKSHPY